VREGERQIADVAEPTLSLRALNRATLARQLLRGREKLGAAKAIERVAGLQAQLARPPFISLWSRLAGFQRDDLARSVNRRDVIRATMLRGTLHLFSRRDFLAFRPAIQPALSSGVRSFLRDRVDWSKADELVAEARAWFDEAPRTFDELRDHLRERFPGCDHRAVAYLVRLELPLVQVPAAGVPWAWPARADFAPADSWLGEPVAAQGDGHDLALRYLAAFGPASAADFQRWSGLASARAIFAELGAKLRTFRDERRRELFDLPDAPRPAEGEEAPVRFLPEFDNLLLAYDERARIIASDDRPRIYTKNLMVPATFIVDGFVAGTWRVERRKGAARLIAEPFTALRRPVTNELAEEGEKLLRFVEPDAKAFAVEFAKASRR
jgi:hypothetical protein